MKATDVAWGLVILLSVMNLYLTILASNAKPLSPWLRLPTRYEMYALFSRITRAALWTFVLFTVWAHFHRPDPRLYAFRDMRVVQAGDDHPYRFWLEDHDGSKFYTTVCRDTPEPPPFKSGMTLSLVIFVDKGDCWSLDTNQHAGYFIERNLNGEPTGN